MALKKTLTVILWNFERKQRRLHVVSPLSLVEPLCPFGIVLSRLLVLVFFHLFIIQIYIPFNLKVPTAIYHLSQGTRLVGNTSTLLNPSEVHCYSICLLSL